MRFHDLSSTWCTAVSPFTRISRFLSTRVELKSELNVAHPNLYPSKAVLVEQEVEHAHRDHAPLVAQGLHHVAHEHDLLEAVVDAERGGLLPDGLLGRS